MAIREVTLVDFPGQEFSALLLRALGHMFVGLGEALLDRAQDHVVTRTQFGQLLGSLQTVQHRLASVYVQLAGARSALEMAWSDLHPLLSAAAKHEAGVACEMAVVQAQQLCGAMGFTWEYGLHQSVRRFHVLDAMLGSNLDLAGGLGSELIRARNCRRGVVQL